MVQSLFVCLFECNQTTTTTCTRPGITVPAGPGRQRAESPAQPMLLGGTLGLPRPAGLLWSAGIGSAPPTAARTPEAVGGAGHPGRPFPRRGRRSPQGALGRSQPGAGPVAQLLLAGPGTRRFLLRLAQPRSATCSPGSPPHRLARSLSRSLSPVSPAARLQEAKPHASKAAAGSHQRRSRAVAPRPFVTPLPIVRPRSRRCPISGGGRG